MSKYGAFSGPYFSAFGLNMERYGVSLRTKSERGKIRTRKNSVFDTFHTVIDIRLGLLEIWKGSKIDPPLIEKLGWLHILQVNSVNEKIKTFLIIIFLKARRLKNVNANSLFESF